MPYSARPFYISIDFLLFHFYRFLAFSIFFRDGEKRKHTHIENRDHGFYGAYNPGKDISNHARIIRIGDDLEDRRARSAAYYLLKRGVNGLARSPAKKNYSFHSYPLDRIESAISYLKKMGNTKIGIAGASTTGTLALVAASYFK